MTQEMGLINYCSPCF